MTDPTLPISVTDRSHGPWAWVGSRQTSAFMALEAACAAAGIELVDAGDWRATAYAVDMSTSAGLPSEGASQAEALPWLLLASSTEEIAAAHEQARPCDDIESLDVPPEAIVARLKRIEDVFRQGAVAMCWMPPPICPPVRQGDAQSYLVRARWTIEHPFHATVDPVTDLRQAIQLDDSLWEPWVLLARLVGEDAAQQLSWLEQAVRLGGGFAAQEPRVRLLMELRRFADAERAVTTSCEGQTLAPHELSRLLRHRAFARIQVGNYAGALDDMAATADASEAHLLGRYQWIAGDLEGAYRTFTAPTLERREVLRVWGHLCQVAHGWRDAPMPPLDCVAEREPVSLTGARILTSDYPLDERDMGPPQRGVWIWHALTDLFLDRITPNDLLTASQSALAESDAWRFPEAKEGTPVWRMEPPSCLWRSQLMFFIGMWHLSKDEVERARQALSEATHADDSCSLEKIAARAQMRRLDTPSPADVAAGAFRALEPTPPPPPPEPHPHLQKFVDLQMTLPDLWATPAGPVLKFDGHDLGDKGLATLMASRNLRFVVRLELQNNGITPAGMKAFRKSSHVLNLVDLNLSGNPIGDEGLQHLLANGALLALHSLDLTDTGLTDDGAQLLVDQPNLKLQRLVLGNRHVDMPVWCKLLDRYGIALYASGVFRTPYEPPFDPDIQVCFSTPPANDRSFALGRARCELTFPMRDYVEFLWTRAAARESKSMRADHGDQVDNVRELERRLASWTSKIYPLENPDGFALLRSGRRPLSLRCPDCDVKYVWPKIAVAQGLESGERARIECPKGHLLH